MKTLKYTNANQALDVEYLVDLIGDNDMLTVYDIHQYVDGVKQEGLNGDAYFLEMFDKDEQVVNSDNTRTKHTLTRFIAKAVDKNLNLSVYEDGEGVVSLNSLTALAVTTTTLAAGNSGVAYSETLEAESGNEPYVWTTESTLPAGITLSTDGVLSGTPTETGTFTLTIIVTDFFGVTAQLVDVDLVINA
jgi:hypothetical protein